jgi:hypothetical protein
VIFFALLGIGIIAAVLVAAAMSLFLRRHGEPDQPDPGWVATSEVFRDPTTDRVMRVWADNAGGRHYLAEKPGRTQPS